MEIFLSYYVWIFFLIICKTYSQDIYQTSITIHSEGTQYSPIHPTALLISINHESSFEACTTKCIMNPLCRIFDYGVNQPEECRYFEGDVDTLGSITSSLSPTSIAAVLDFNPHSFIGYGQTCSSKCSQSRYLRCGSNSTCECMSHTYWNPIKLMCLPQSLILGTSCQPNMDMCREDLNYTCLQFNQCGPLSLLSGITIADSTTIIDQNSTIGLNLPAHMTIMRLSDKSLLVVDGNNNRILRFVDNGLGNYNISIAAQSWSGGNSLTFPSSIFIDEYNGKNLYVSDCSNHRVVLFSAMQSISPLPRIVAGGTWGSALNQLYCPTGLKTDNASNIIISDTYNHRVVLWSPNATSGIVLAGIPSSAGNDTQSLNTPFDVVIDEENSWLYVADAMNNRVQRFSLYGGIPKNGTSVAGGNGYGSGSHQLKMPVAIWVSKKTGAIYIVDQHNSRIQRWNQNATKGVTIAGHPLGYGGSTSTLLFGPNGIAIDPNETVMYISDAGNRRIQKFKLIEYS